jgi:hypothetical protein
MRKNRLVALVDLSEETKPLYPSIQHFSSLIDGDIVLAHEVTKILPAFIDSEQKRILMADEKKEAIKKLELQTKAFENIAYDLMVTERNVVEFISEYTSIDYDDWVVTGLKTHDSIMHYFTKGTIQKIIDETDFIKVILPCDKEITSVTKIKFATHYKFPVNYRKLETVINALSKKIDHITFFTIVNDSDDETKVNQHLEELKSHFPNLDIKTKIIYSNNSFSEIEHVTSPETLLIIQKGTRNLVDVISRKFTTNSVLKSKLTPLLILPS